MSASMRTLPRVFIIESLDLADEKADRFEGGLLSKMLRLSGSEPEYMYLRTRRELEKAVGLFAESGFRYLHFSCHGRKNGIDLTLDKLRFSELSELLAPALQRKRVFFSSCSVMNNDKCAAALLPDSGCLSLIGPTKAIYFDRAAIFWSAFYHLMLRDEARSMQRTHLQRTTAMLQHLFGVHMRYFTASRSAKRGFQRVAL
jgi:hypothetical protein